MDVKWAAVILLGALGADRADSAEKFHVFVYVQSDHWPLMGTSEALASKVLARIGVQVKWRSGRLPEIPCAGRRCIGIRMVEHAPVSVSPYAFASALPFGASASAISVYEDRIQRRLNSTRALRDVLLAYVFAHELAHVMMGNDYHSNAGVLKAQWSSVDFADMRSRRLAFLDGDSDRIREGMAVSLAPKRVDSLV